MLLRRFCCCILLCALWTASSNAQSYTWTGATNSDFGTTTNWSPNGVPGPADNAIVNATGSGAPSINADYTVASFSISGGKTASIATGFTLTATTVSLNQASLNGGGTLAIATGGTLTSDHPTTGNTINPMIANAGTITVNTGSLRFANGGTSSGGMNASAANTLLILQGTTVFSTGASLNGSIQLEATLTINAAVSMTGTLYMVGYTANIKGSGSLAIDGKIIAQSNSGFGTNIAVPVTISATGGIQVDGSNTYLAFNADVTCDGPISVSAGGQLAVLSTRTFTMSNTITLNGGALGPINGSGGILKLTATGKLNSDIASGSNPVWPYLDNAGAVTVQSGELILNGGGRNTGSITATAAGALFTTQSNTFIVDAGSVLAGKFKTINGWTINPTLTLTGDLTLAGYTANLGGPGALTVTGKLAAVGNSGFGTTTTVPITIPAGGTLEVTGSNGYLNINSNSSCAGTLNVTATGVLALTVGKTLTCSGAMVLNQGRVEGGGTLAITSTGTLDSDNVSGTNSIVCITTNAGKVSVKSGVLDIGSNYIQSAGSTSLSGGNLKGDPKINGGVLDGAGTITGTLTNGGTVEPGGAQTAGTITVTGNYTQNTSGALNVEIGGTTAGAFDQLSVAGMTLNGTLNVSTLNSFAPAGADTFEIIQGTSRNGTFSTVSSGATGLTALYGTANVSLGQGIQVSAISAPNPAIQGRAVEFSVTATDPAGGALSYSWDFGDGSAAETTNPVSHTYTSAKDFTVKVTVTGASQTVSRTQTVTIVGPNAGADGVLNIQEGGATVVNPLNKMGARVSASNGGALQLDVDVSTFAPRGISDGDINTEFFGLNGSLGLLRLGKRAVGKFSNAGVYFAETTVTDSASGKTGKGRKMLVVSAREAGESGALPPAPSSAIEFKSFKGKVLFTKTTADTMTLQGSFKLPQGFDPKQHGTIAFGMGNILDRTTVDSKGKAALPSELKHIKKLQIKYPKLDGVAKGGEVAQLTVTYYSPNMDNAGMETEGVSSLQTGTTKLKIQAVLMIGGVSYDGLFPVDMKMSAKGDAATLSGKAAK